jgi:hypothetical protein
MITPPGPGWDDVEEAKVGRTREKTLVASAAVKGRRKLFDVPERTWAERMAPRRAA